MTVRLVILGLLRERPLYGYEIKQILEESMSDWTSIAFGSIYFALDKLADEKFVEKVEVEQTGRRPSRSVYQITAAGKQEFLRLLREEWRQVERSYYSIDLCLYFLNSLPIEEVKKSLRIRQVDLEKALDHLQAHREQQLTLPEVPRLASAIFDHSLAHTRTELDWVTDLVHKLERGEYP
jgi:DNA-binding PadR family transcriptional regulator